MDRLKVPKDVKYPVAIGFVGRKRSVDFTKTTMETWKKIIPPDSYEIRDQDKEIVIEKRVKVSFGGLDDQDNINKFNSAEFAFIAIDQAEETTRADVSVLQASLRLRYNAITPPYKELYTANPADCWLKEDFVYGKRPQSVYIPALYTDNPNLPANYGETLERSFSFDSALLRAYREGDWEALQGDAVLIPTRAIEALQNNEFVEPYEYKFVSVDPSQGGDEFVIMVMKNSEILHTEILHEKNEMVATGQVDVIARRHGTSNVIIDAIGIGGPIASRLSEIGHTVFRIVSSNVSPDQQCKNLKAAMWFEAAKKVQDKKVRYPKDEELRRQLSSVQYFIRNGKVQIEEKYETRKRLGRSPDRADSFVMGLWAISHCQFAGLQVYYDLKREAQMLP